MANVYDQIINGTFNALNPSVAEMYAGIYPTATPSAGPTYQPGMMGRGITSVGSPNLTAAEQQLLNQQLQQSKMLQAGYNPNGTPKPVPIQPSWAQPTTPSAVPTLTALDQSAIDARTKPGTWMALSRQLAQVGMRQRAFQQANGMTPASPAVAAPAKGGGLASLITGKGTPRGSSGGLFGLLFGGSSAPVKTGPSGVGTNGYTYVNGQNMGYSPAEQAKREAQGKAIGDANRKNPNPTYSASGENNAFMTRDYQNSVRKQTGY